VFTLSSSWADGAPAVVNLLVNGQVVVGNTPVYATNSSGASQEVSYTIPAGTVVNSVAVAYVNDFFRSTTEDRNLYVNSATLNGVDLQLGAGVYTPVDRPVQAGERLVAWNGPLTWSGAAVANAMAADQYAHSVTVDAGAGIDTVIYGGRFLNYNVSFISNDILISSKAGDFGPDALWNTERVLFDDKGQGFLYSVGGAGGVTQDGNNRVIDGGVGIDAVLYNGSRNDYTISRTAAGNYVVTHNGAGDADVLVNVERLVFRDQLLAVDINGDAGQAYRLYQAAFNRTPDIAGLGFQMSALDNGLTLGQVGDNFLHSPEFQATYGNLSNLQYVQQLYLNVLHRPGEDAGVQFHLANLNSGAIGRHDLLVQFSESPENQANVIGTIANGMVYTL
jgi:hypothetical protein